MIPLAEWKASRKQRKLVKKVLKSGRLTYGPVTAEFEERFAELHGARQALFTSSGTDALKIALHALKDRYKWQDGDEVIIPAVTFIATMNVVIMCGLKPVLVDVERKTVNIDPALIEAAITKRTRAIIPVHLFGQSADMDSIMKLATKHKLKVIEDSCETMFVNKIRGDVACFSTYVAHLLVTGIGGFACTNSAELATIMRSMMFHGRDEAYLSIDDNGKPGIAQKRYLFPRFGYSDRATELEAALGLGQLDHWDEMIRTRRANAGYLWFKLYRKFGITFPFKDIRAHAFMFFPLFVSDRDGLMAHLEANNIHTRTMMPLTNQPIVKKYFGKNIEKDFPVAKWVNEHGLLLGCHQYLKHGDLRYIAEVIKEYYEDLSDR